MGIKGVLECEVDIKSSGDLFHELFGSKPHHVSNITPNNIHACELHEGDFGKPGSVIEWHYTAEGKRCTVKELIEAIDEEKKMIRFKILEGDDVTQYYKSLVITSHVILKGEITTVKWILEFEKINDNGPYPTKEMDILIAITKDVEAHHLQA